MTTYRAFYRNRDENAVATQFEDFFKYAAADWTVTAVGAGTRALIAGVGGLLAVTNAAADNDAAWLQVPTEEFKYVAGKRLQFTMRFKLSRVDSDFMAGLYITDTDPIGGVSDGIYFRKLAAEAGLSLIVEKDAAESAAVVLTTIVADTWYIAEFYYDGADDKIKAFINRLPAGSVPLTNVPNDEEIALSFGHQNGSANAGVLTVDFIGVQQER